MQLRVFIPWLAAVAGAAQVPPAPVLTRYCTGCHNAKLKTGNLALDAIATQPVAANAAVWEKVVRRLRARQMPPSGLPRPDEATYVATAAALESELDRLSAAKPNPGRPDTFRRLNRTEYRNAIRDILAIDVDASALLPADESSHGFDNITVGDLAPTLLERYLGASEKVSRLAVGIAGKRPGGDTIVFPPDLTQEEHFKELPLGTRGGGVVPYTFAVDGEYEISARLARDRNENIEGLHTAHEVEFLLDGERLGLFAIKPAPKGKDDLLLDQHLKSRVTVKAGPHNVGVTFIKQPTVLLDSARQPYQARFNFYRHPRPQPAIYSISITGPFMQTGAGETPSRRRIFVCREQTDECATRILTTVARRAWRRPVQASEVGGPLKFYREAKAKDGFEAGIEVALSSILVSPEFLFRIEQDPKGVNPASAYALSDLELATRLAFFLWSSVPDDELLEVAAKGKLKEPAMMEQQARRMLKDPRSRTLVSNFAEQWLYLRNVASATPDMRLFPDFDDNLRRAFREETELFVESVIREDRNVLDLLTANYTYLNERLAKHYGIPNIYGSRFRRVDFGPGGPRGGLLRQGSILTVTSYATRTSPVIRGKWVLENILGIPPPPPPGAVPPLKENPSIGKVQSVRERLAEHRKNPACHGCHQLMDPVGFSLESFDAVGRYREMEDNRPIDDEGGLPDGSTFTGYPGLQKAIGTRPHMFAGTLTEKLLTYALGRGVEYYDAPAVRGVLRAAEAKDYKFSALVAGIVTSKPFLMRRSQ